MFDLCISLHSGPVWTTQWVPCQPELHGEILSRNTNTTTKKPEVCLAWVLWNGMVEQSPWSFVSSSSGLAFALDWIFLLGLSNYTPVKSASNFWQKSSSL